MVSSRVLILRILFVIGISVGSNGSSEFDSSQQPKQLSSGPVVRNVDISSSSTFGNRHVSGGKYRSSYYYPKTLVITTSTTTTPSPIQSSSVSSGSNPVWVVWGRQGTPFDGGYSSPSSNDYYQYQVDNDNAKYYSSSNDKYYNNDKYSNNDKYYNKDRYYRYNNDKYYNKDKYHNKDKYYNNYLNEEYEEEDPYDTDASSMSYSSSKKNKHNWVRSVDSDEEDQDNNSLDERDTWVRPSKSNYDRLNWMRPSKSDLDGLSLAQIKGLMKTRRTGGSEILGGILSLKGLKLGAIGLFYLFRGVMMLLWKFLPWIFLAMVALLFVPVPILTIPAAAGRSGGVDSVNFNLTELTNSAYSLLERLADSETCVERISCELRRQSRDTWLHSTIKRLIYQYESQLPQSLQRMAKAFVQNRRCKHYKCQLINKTINKKPIKQN